MHGYKHITLSYKSGSEYSYVLFEYTYNPLEYKALDHRVGHSLAKQGLISLYITISYKVITRSNKGPILAPGGGQIEVQALALGPYSLNSAYFLMKRGPLGPILAKKGRFGSLCNYLITFN